MSTDNQGSAAPSRRIYARAPIVEAVIDIQVFSSKQPDISLLTKCADAVHASFPNRLPINVVSMGMEAKEGKFAAISTPDQQQTGWRLSNSANDRVLQLQMGSFTYSHMPPYTQWEIFKGEAMPLWEKFSHSATCRRRGRLSLPKVA